jgi:CPA2 family monovalent cation:H+ antiporter-2
VREVLGSALDATGRVLGALGYSATEAESILRRFKEYDEKQIAQSAPHRHDMKTLIALSEQGRRDIAELLAAEARSAPQVHQDDARGDAERGGHERAADRL